MVGECEEWCRFFPERIQRRTRSPGQSVCFRAALFQSEYRGVGRFLRGDIFASALAEFFGRLRHVEYVVDDLECEADALAEGGERLELRGRGVRAHRAEADAGGEQRGGLAAVDVFQIFAAELAAFAFEVGDLPADEPAAAGCECEVGDLPGDGMAL